MSEDSTREQGTRRPGRTPVGEPSIATIFTHDWSTVDLVDRGVALAFVYFDSASKQGHEFRIPASRVAELERAIAAFNMRSRGRS